MGETLTLTKAANLLSNTQTLPHIGIFPLTNNTLPLDGGLTYRTLEQKEVELEVAQVLSCPT